MNIVIKASSTETRLALKKPASLRLLTLRADNASASEMTQTGQGFIIKSGSHSENRISLVGLAMFVIQQPGEIKADARNQH